MILSKNKHGLAVFAASSDIRPELADIKTDGVTSVATDSFTLVEIVETDGVKGDTVMVPAKEVKKTAVSSLKDKEFIGNPHLVEKYPKYNKIFDDARKLKSVEIILDARYLAQIASYAASLGEKIGNSKRLTITVPLKRDMPIMFSASNHDVQMRALLMPIQNKSKK